MGVCVYIAQFVDAIYELPYAFDWVGGYMCGREREGVWGGRRGDGDLTVVLANKGVTRVGSKRYNCL